MPIPYLTLSPSGLFATFARNLQGRDFVVSAIRGDIASLRRLLEACRFDGARDRLFSTGDLIGNGPRSIEVLSYLHHPWFHSIRGAVEDACIDGTPTSHHPEGGAWFQSLPPGQQQLIVNLLRRLPMAFEIELGNHQHAGVIYAPCPFEDWALFRAMLSNPQAPIAPDQEASLIRTTETDDACWSMDSDPLEGFLQVNDIDIVFVGHNPATSGASHKTKGNSIILGGTPSRTDPPFMHLIELTTGQHWQAEAA